MEQALASVMKNIGEALGLDDDRHDKEAYVKYLDCILCITSNLLQAVRDKGGDVVVTKEINKQVKLAQQCVDRVVVLIDRIGCVKRPTGMVLPVQERRATARPKLSVSVPPLPPEPTANTFARPKSKSPMEVAYHQNQLLMTAYRARMARMNKRNPNAANLSLTLQRKMAENLALAKKQEMVLAKKMQERQKRLEEQAAKRFATPIGMSEEEQEQRHIYKKILEYEQDAKWLQKCRSKLDLNPQEPEPICQLIQEILRCSDHPLTLLLKSYQYKVYEKIYPLVCNKKQLLANITVPLPQSLWPAELVNGGNHAAPPAFSANSDNARSGCFSFVGTGNEDDDAESREEETKSVTDSETASATNDGDGSTEDLSSCKNGEADQNCSKTCEENVDAGVSTPESTEAAKTERDVRSAVPSEGGESADLSEKSGDATHDLSQEEAENKVDRREDSRSTKPEKITKETSKSGEEDFCPEDINNSSFTLSLTEEQDSNAEFPKTENHVEDADSSHMLSQGNEPADKNQNATDATSTTGSDDATPASFAQQTKEGASQAMAKGDRLQARLTQEQTQAGSVLRQVSQDYEKYNAENMDDLFDDNDDNDGVDEEKDNVQNDLPESDQMPSMSSVRDGGPSSLISRSSSDGSMQDFPSLPSVEVDQGDIERMSREAYQRHLKNISADVHQYMEKMLILFTIAYEQLDSPLGRDQCYASLEETFFKPLWKFFLMLFRLANYKDELSVACKMTQRADATPMEMGVIRKLSLVPTDGSASRESPRPYQKAIEELRRIKDHYTMLSKLECVVKVMRCILDSIKDFYIGQGYRASDVPCVGADDLLPVVSYVVMKTNLPQLVSECHAMDEFIHEGYDDTR